MPIGPRVVLALTVFCTVYPCAFVRSAHAAPNQQTLKEQLPRTHAVLSDTGRRGKLWNGFKGALGAGGLPRASAEVLASTIKTALAPVQARLRGPSARFNPLTMKLPTLPEMKGLWRVSGMAKAQKEATRLAFGDGGALVGKLRQARSWSPEKRWGAAAKLGQRLAADSRLQSACKGLAAGQQPDSQKTARVRGAALNVARDSLVQDQGFTRDEVKRLEHASKPLTERAALLYNASGFGSMRFLKLGRRLNKLDLYRDWDGVMGLGTIVLGALVPTLPTISKHLAEAGGRFDPGAFHMALKNDPTWKELGSAFTADKADRMAELRASEAR